MKLFLNLIIAVMIYAIAVDVELNANAKELNYLVSIAVLPFLILAIYARTHISEFKKFFNDEGSN